MDTIAVYVRTIRGTKFLDKATEARLCRAARRGNAEARESLVKSILPLAMKLARKFTGQGVDIADLIQAANVGVLYAVRKFNPRKGRLTTYAYLAILRELRYEISRSCCTVSLPTHTTPKNYEQVSKVRNSIFPLDDEDLACPQQESDSEECEERIANIERLLKNLGPRTRQIVRYRLAGRLIRSIAAELGVSRQYVSQTYLTAVAAMQYYANVGQRVA